VIETTLILLNIPLGGLIGFACTVSLVIGMSYAIIAGTGRPR